MDSGSSSAAASSTVWGFSGVETRFKLIPIIQKAVTSESLLFLLPLFEGATTGVATETGEQDRDNDSSAGDTKRELRSCDRLILFIVYNHYRTR